MCPACTGCDLIPWRIHETRPWGCVLAYADTRYAVPGYPVTTSIEETGAELVK